MGEVRGHSMVGGTGQDSYLHNSYYQRSMYQIVRDMIDDAIYTELDVSAVNGAIRIADLGCSVGPNTFYAVQGIIDAIMTAIDKLQSPFGNAHDQNKVLLEFQVFFNDQVGNDFNVLLNTLPADRRYFASAVPGSFHKRLFPRDSIHFFNSSMSLHWLSKDPGVANKGRIHAYGGERSVRDAYHAQFMADMSAFLNSRAEELVIGGMIAMMLLCHDPSSGRENMPLDEFYGAIVDPIFQKLLLEGDVREDQLDSFQIPIYTPTIDELKEAININGRYIIRVAEVVDERWEGRQYSGGEATEADVEEFTRSIIATFKATHDEVIKAHFGEQVAGQVFGKFPEQLRGYFTAHNPWRLLSQSAFFILQLKE